MKRKAMALLGMMLLLSGTQAQTTTPTLLLVGDPAPGLSGARWVTGEPVSRFEPGKIYVVDFGAGEDPTYLGELQTLYRDKGVIVIGVRPTQAAAVVGEAPYRIATDEGGTALSSAWVQASGRGVPPVSYVVDKDGKIAYIGEPGRVPEVVEGIVDGSYRPEERFGTREAQMVQIKLSRNEVDEAMAMLEQMEKEPGQAPWVIPQYFYILAAVKKDPTAAKSYAERMAGGPAADPEIVVRFVETLLGSEVSNPDLQLAGRLLDRAEVMAAAKPGLKGRIDAARFELLLEKQDYPAATALANRIAGETESDAATLNRVALAITNTQPPAKKDLLPMAERMASRAVELDGSNANTVGTLARVMAEQGNYDRAIALQTQALAAAKPSVKREFAGTLEEYKTRAGGNRPN